MKTLVKHLLKLIIFLLICTFPAAVVAISDWNRFGYKFVVGGVLTFAFTALSLLPALSGPAPRSIIYGTAFASTGVLTALIRVYFFDLPLGLVDAAIPSSLVIGAFLLCNYCCSAGGFKKSWTDVVAALATVFGAEAGFIWGIISSGGIQL